MSHIDKPKGEKYWKITFYVDGKRYRRSLRVTTKRRAEEMQEEINFLIRKGQINPQNLFGSLPKKEYTLYQLIQEFNVHILTDKTIKANTCETYRYSTEEVLTGVVDEMPINKITPQFIEFELLPSLNNRFASPNTVRHHMVNLSKFFGYIVRRGLLQENPIKGKIPPRQKKMPIWFKREEIDDILEYFSNPNKPSWQRLYFPLMLNTGMRRTEQFDLLWSKNVFPDSQLIKFPGKGKYAGKERIIPLNDYCLELFAAAERSPASDRVFWQVRNTTAVRSAWDTACKDLNLNYKVHEFRSNYATWFMKNDGNLWKLMQIMGWEDYETAKIYLAFAPDFVQSERNRVVFRGRK